MLVIRYSTKSFHTRPPLFEARRLTFLSLQFSNYTLSSSIFLWFAVQSCFKDIQQQADFSSNTRGSRPLLAKLLQKLKYYFAQYSCPWYSTKSSILYDPIYSSLFEKLTTAYFPLTLQLLSFASNSSALPSGSPTTVSALRVLRLNKVILPFNGPVWSNQKR